MLNRNFYFKCGSLDSMLCSSHEEGAAESASVWSQLLHSQRVASRIHGLTRLDDNAPPGTTVAIRCDPVLQFMPCIRQPSVSLLSSQMGRQPALNAADGSGTALAAELRRIVEAAPATLAEAEPEPGRQQEAAAMAWEALKLLPYACSGPLEVQDLKYQCFHRNKCC